MDKLRAISFFCRAAETKSFSAGAQALGVVPSALSKAIAGLEREVGFRLLNRSTRRLSLTHEGEVYYEHCRALMQNLEEAEAKARGGRIHAQGNLRLGIHPALRVAVLGALGTFLDRHPNIRIETVITNSGSAVIDEGLDVVARIGDLVDSALIAVPLGHVQSVVCAAPNYLATWGEPRQPDDLVRHRAIIYGRRDEASNTDWTLTKGRQRVKISMPVRLVLRDGIGLTDAVVGGCGIALPINISVRHLLTSRALRVLLPEWSGERYPVFAVMPPGPGNASAKVRVCLEFLKSVVEYRNQ